MTASHSGSWAAFPAAQHTPDPVDGANDVIGVGARCDLAGEDDRTRHYVVSEYLVLDNDDRITLHSSRGFSIGGPLDARALVTTSLNAVLPDDCEVTGEEHDWEELAFLASRRGISVTAARLCAVPYEVTLTDRTI